MFEDKLKELKELKKEVKMDDWGYHDKKEVDAFDEKVKEVTDKIDEMLTELKEAHPQIEEYLALDLERRRISSLYRGFNYPK